MSDHMYYKTQEHPVPSLCAYEFICTLHFVKPDIWTGLNWLLFRFFIFSPPLLTCYYCMWLRTEEAAAVVKTVVTLSLVSARVSIPCLLLQNTTHSPCSSNWPCDLTCVYFCIAFIQNVFDHQVMKISLIVHQQHRSVQLQHFNSGI